MSNDTFITQVMDGLKEHGVLMMTDDFMQQLITTLHANVTAVNSLIKIVELENEMLGIHGLLPSGNRQVESLKELSIRIAEIAFSIEGVRDEQR